MTQIAGTLLVDGDAEISQLRIIGGNRRIASTADIGCRTSVDVATRVQTPLRSVVSLAVTAGALALVGARLECTRRRNLDNIADTVGGYPVVTVTIGLLLTLTLLSLFLFMAFTLVLVPVSILGMLVDIAVTALGVIAWGHRLGRRLPLSHPAAATAAGVAGIILGLQVLGAIPLVGDLIVGFVLLSGLGAVTLTYMGFAEFHPAALPD